MKIERQSATIMDCYGESLTKERGIAICKALEEKGRICYKSLDKITEDSYIKFLSGIIKNGHTSVLEHCSLTAHIVTNKAIETEIVRHRIASYSISSTRYCNFSQDKFGNEITFIEPCKSIADNLGAFAKWKSSVEKAESSYLDLIELGYRPDHARGVLPLDVKSEINMTANLREWRHFLSLRCSDRAHEQIRAVAKMICKEFYNAMPVIFEDLYEQYCK